MVDVELMISLCLPLVNKFSKREIFDRSGSAVNNSVRAKEDLINVLVTYSQ